MKKILLVLTLALVLGCMLAFSVSAETELKPQDSNAYGDLSFFDESVTVGRTDPKYGFTPYFDEAGTIYARVVIGDGTTFYTFPTAYALSNTKLYGDGEKSIYCLDLSSLNSAMASATGTNPGWTSKNVYRIEMPCHVLYLNGGSEQAFSDYTNLIEVYLQPNSTVKDNNKGSLFWRCSNLEVIHNLDTFVFTAGSLNGSFQNCVKLTSLTFGVSPKVTTTSENAFNGCTALQSVNLAEAFPNLTAIGKQTFYGCTSLKSISSDAQEYAVVIPNGVTSIGQGAFYNCDAVKYVSIPATLTSLGSTSFYSCGALEFVDFNGNTNTITTGGWGIFYQCTSLKAVSLPANLTKIDDRMFYGCTALEAVCLPTNLQKIQSNGSGQGTFDNNSKMYFVQSSFEVCDEDGSFLGGSFVMPSKPSVYYMPENANFTGHVINGGLGSEVGTFFNKCYALNDVIVFSESFTNINSSNEFANLGTKDSPKTVVFLGDITSCVNFNNTTYTSFIFANKADKTPNDLGIVKTYKNSNNSESYWYFCASGMKYDFRTSAGATSGDALTANIEAIVATGAAEAKHAKELSKATEATCTLPKMVADFCFCGAFIPGTETTEGEALGHGEMVVLGYVYVNYMENGVCSSRCDRCGDVVESETEALFTCLGISAKTFGDIGLTQGYAVNKKAIESYKANSEGFDFGVLAYANVSGEEIAPKPGDDKVVDVVFDNMANDFINVMVTGIPDDFKDSAIILCLYVKDKGTFYYLNNGVTSETIVGNSYNEVLG